jgi:hypothetical protein
MACFFYMKAWVLEDGHSFHLHSLLEHPDPTCLPPRNPPPRCKARSLNFKPRHSEELFFRVLKKWAYFLCLVDYAEWTIDSPLLVYFWVALASSTVLPRSSLPVWMGLGMDFVCFLKRWAITPVYN